MHGGTAVGCKPGLGKLELGLVDEGGLEDAGGVHVALGLSLVQGRLPAHVEDPGVRSGLARRRGRVGVFEGLLCAARCPGLGGGRADQMT